MQKPDDHWADGASYEAFIGRWSRAAARSFVGWLDPVPGLRWLDVGCGTGALSTAIVQSAEPLSVTGCDPSAPFIAYASAQNHDPRLSYQVATLEDLPQTPGGYGGIISGFVLNFIADPVEAIKSMMNRMGPGGLVAAYVWDYTGRMDFLQTFWEAAVTLDAAAKHLDESQRFPLCRPEGLERTFREAGLTRVRTGAFDVPFLFPTFSDYWEPFLAGTGPAPNYVASLSAGQRNQLAESLKRRLDPADGGEIRMTARAWAVRGEIE